MVSFTRQIDIAKLTDESTSICCSSCRSYNEKQYRY